MRKDNLKLKILHLIKGAASHCSARKNFKLRIKKNYFYFSIEEKNFCVIIKTISFYERSGKIPLLFYMQEKKFREIKKND